MLQGIDYLLVQLKILSEHQSVAECAVLGIADKLKGQLPIGLIVLKAGVDKDNETISKECIQMVRNKIGPVAAFKVAIVIKRLPKQDQENFKRNNKKNC